jgi:hypothetical protein
MFGRLAVSGVSHPTAADARGRRPALNYHGSIRIGQCGEAAKGDH